MTPSTLAAEATPKKSHSTVLRAVFGTLAAIVAFVAGGAALLFASKYGQFHISFWIGLLTPVLIGILIGGSYLAAHPVTKKLIGTLVAIGTALVVLTVTIIMVATQATSTFLWDIFGWGFLDAILLAIAIAAVIMYGWLSSKFFVKKTEPESETEK
jgi:MFS family permease